MIATLASALTLAAALPTGFHTFDLSLKSVHCKNAVSNRNGDQVFGLVIFSSLAKDQGAVKGHFTFDFGTMKEGTTRQGDPAKHLLKSIVIPNNNKDYLVTVVLFDKDEVAPSVAINATLAYYRSSVPVIAKAVIRTPMVAYEKLLLGLPIYLSGHKTKGKNDSELIGHAAVIFSDKEIDTAAKSGIDESQAVGQRQRRGIYEFKFRLQPSAAG